ncbi:MAG: diaminopimelate decarboxylase [Clostridia bacterium]|nr:diaminopimelate decarboxylase [Clostridia bacterium]
MSNFVCDNIGATQGGHLTFGGLDTVELAKQYGTPLYLMDEDRIRHNIRVYTEAIAKYMPAGSGILYASKAASFKEMYRIAGQEGIGVDVVSPGELMTAAAAGFDLSNVFFHGNNKTDDDIWLAMDQGIGYFVVDNAEELAVIDREADTRGIVQKILLRLTPGIDPHTYAAINTGKVDSKFGTAIETGQAEQLTVYALSLKHVRLSGFHCHVGSQVFAEDVFERSASVMLEFAAGIRAKTGYTAGMIDLGGGYGVRYVDSDPYLDIAKKIRGVAQSVRATCIRLSMEPPAILLEPGRSIVADAGMTLYTVGTVKHIPGYRNYVSIDGGMSDNPRYALYGARYTVLPADRLNEERKMVCTLAGRCCESGDVIQDNILMPEDIGRGDLVAVCTTGAYNYSMASNYNRIGRPPVVMLQGGESRIAVRRESLDDLLRLDI